MNKSTTRKRFKVKKIKEKHLQNAKVKGFLYTEHSFAYQNTTKTNTQSIENHVASSWPSYSKCCFMAACRVSLSHAEPSGRHSVFQPPCFCFHYFVWGGGVVGFWTCQVCSSLLMATWVYVIFPLLPSPQTFQWLNLFFCILFLKPMFVYAQSIRRCYHWPHVEIK